MSKRKVLYFVRPYQVETRVEEIPPVQPHEVQVQVAHSALSAGTELLFYRGQVPNGMVVDSTIRGLQHAVQYPLSYGYCCVGEVTKCGAEVDSSWIGRRVFAFHPHASAIVCEPLSLIPIPPELNDEQAVFLPTMETAVNFVMDAQPLIGERILVMGLGVVGLITTYLLRQYPLCRLATTDLYAKRLEVAQRWQVESVYAANVRVALADFNPDVILELSSNPNALADALHLAAYGTRILIGSWYGDKVANLALGGNFHRNRVHLISSQVSTIDGRLSNRWDKPRRLEVAWEQLRALPTQELVSHRLPISRADEAFCLLDQHPDQTLQVILTY
jgi:2-desacetyl-2-hydroxyethyl bacteriochlorophyllide A dehydrogenase